VGTVFERGKSFQIQYYKGGRKFRETVRSSRREDAVRLLKQREGDIAAGRPPGVYADRVTFEDLTTDFIRDYEINGKRSVGKAKKSVERLTEVFGGWRAAKITTADIRAYVERRRQNDFANASINRELAALKRAFHLAVQAGRLHQVPHIPMLKEAPPRSGFFEWEPFQVVLRYLPPYIKPIVLFAYELGWRLREVLGLQWHQLDLTEGYVRLNPGTTKNNEGRVAYFSPDLLATLRAQHAMTRELERSAGVIIPWVFHRKGGRQVRGVRKAWNAACRQAGVPGMVFHDLRRTAIRNMLRAGVTERVAMLIAGHKTRSVFERYNIVSEADLKDAAKKIAAHHQSAGTLGMHLPKLAP